MNVPATIARGVLAIARAALRAPFELRARGWAAALAATLAIAIAYVEKWPIQHALGGGARGPLETLAQLVARVGDGETVAVIAAVLFLVGELGRSKRALRIAIAFAVSGIWCLTLTKLGQLTFAESRPIAGGAMHFFAFGGHGVSGHASASALWFWPTYEATRGASRPTRALVAAGLIAWALLVGATRIWLDAHFLWNVLAGFLIGEETGRAGVRWLASSESK
ncbi:MAG TPA: phosphatase PAP2 family protein [Polyangiaceae bacterium]|jgi:membrane-associated phospholipid phosphatase